MGLIDVEISFVINIFRINGVHIIGCFGEFVREADLNKF